jgi:hypothetical protein
MPGRQTETAEYDDARLYLTSPTSLSKRPDPLAMFSYVDSSRIPSEENSTTSLNADWFLVALGTMEAFGWAIPARKRFKTELAKQLMEIRKRYVEAGGALLSQQEIENWTEEMRRG